MKYKIIKITGISLALLLNTISFCMQNENKQQRELMFRKILETKKNEICTLPEHKAAQKKYQQFLQEIEEFKAKKIKEMRKDQEYQNNFARIKKAIVESGTYCYENTDLTQAECQQLVCELNKMFFPE